MIKGESENITLRDVPRPTQNRSRHISSLSRLISILGKRHIILLYRMTGIYVESRPRDLL